MSEQSGRRFFAPEVVQTSAMDCGPAALKCLLEGFGIPVSYGRLREACHTDVDGTSIDTIEDLAQQLGLQAEQVMIPLGNLFLTQSMPALIVVRLPTGFTHFVTLWRAHGPFVQIMDPATGRRWLPRSAFLKDVYIHELRLPAEMGRQWVDADDFRAPLERRLTRLGAGRTAPTLIAEAAAMPHWRAIAALDASTRLVESLVASGGLHRGREAVDVVASLSRKGAGDPPAAPDNPPGDRLVIPEAFWSLRPAPRKEPASESEGILIRGAVLVRIRGKQAASSPRTAGDAPRTEALHAAAEDARDRPPETRQPPDAGIEDARPAPLSPELVAALSEPPTRPGREILRLLRGDGVLSFGVLALGIALAAGSVIVEALLLRGAIDIGQELGLVTQRLLAVGYFLIFALAFFLIEFRVTGCFLRLGRRLETRLRLALLEKIPRLVDRYFQSRPISDMAERSHSTHQIRGLPRVGGQLVRAAFSLVFSAAAIAVVDPASAPLAALAAAASIAFPLLWKPNLEETDLRIRTHTGALGRFYLDSLLGLAAVKAHGAERAIRREHESLLVEWAKASHRQLRSIVALEGLQALTGFGIAFAILFLYAQRAPDPAGALLLAYFALYIPTLGEEIVLLVRQYPIHRNLALRLFEPLGAPVERETAAATAAEEQAAGDAAPSRTEPAAAESIAAAAGGAAIALADVKVVAGGHTILDDLDLVIAPGTHVAIVGPSGAGKSSLVGLLLGWHRAARGRVLVDGQPLDAAGLDRLRRETVWIDPAVQLWNRTLLANLRYGDHAGGSAAIADVLEHADLYGVLERLPEGLQTPLGENGGLLSGGEGQRVRLGRGMLRRAVRLVILDEAFRGLDRGARRELIARSRQLWREATVLCITHDVGETREFHRVLVIDGGRVVETGAPAVLAEDRTSRYRALLDAEEKVRSGLWPETSWRRLRLAHGVVSEDRGGGAA